MNSRTVPAAALPAVLSSAAQAQRPDGQPPPPAQRSRAWLRQLALAPGLAGCQSAAPARPVGNYDFGPLPAETLGKALFQGGLRLSGVLAPLWMEASDLNYHLLYSDANQTRAYATSSRNSAKPSILPRPAAARSACAPP